jgi:hypothetical protein
VTTDVTATFVAGRLIYQHTLIWSDAPCYPLCAFSYAVSSETHGVPMTRGGHQAVMPKLCPVSQ